MTELRFPSCSLPMSRAARSKAGACKATFDPAGGRQRVQLEMAELASGEVRLQADAHPMAIRFAPVQTCQMPASARNYVVFKSRRWPGADT